jgi:uncharacterized membrane protein YbhN (UPF0104 family)
MNVLPQNIAVQYEKIKSKIYFALKILIAVLLVVHIYSIVDTKKFAASFIAADIFYLGISIILLIPNIFLQYWKWKLTCEKLIGEKNRRIIFLSLFYGFPAAVFTPARAGEYFGRGLVFTNHHFSKIIIATAVEKFISLLVIFVFGSIGMIYFISEYYPPSIYISVPLMISVIALTILVLVIIFSDQEWFFKLISPMFRFKLFTKLSNSLLIIKNLDRDFVFKMIFISVLFFLCYIFQFIVLFAAFSHHIVLGDFFLAAVVIMFAKTILSPLTLSDFGVREGASVFFLSHMGESSATALNASLVLFAVNILVPALAGAILLFIKNTDGNNSSNIS